MIKPSKIFDFRALKTQAALNYNDVQKLYTYQNALQPIPSGLSRLKPIISHKNNKKSFLWYIWIFSIPNSWPSPFFEILKRNGYAFKIRLLELETV